MREKLKDEAYFSGYFAEQNEVEEMSEGFVENEQNPYVRRLGVQYSKYQAKAHVTIARYSAGYAIEEVHKVAGEVADELSVFVELGQQDEDYFLYGDGGGYSGGVDKWYRDLAFCILFDLPREKCDIVLDHLVLQMKNPELATDALVNKMVKALGYPGQDETDHLIWPEAYEPLYECFKTPRSDVREKKLQFFVENWYKEMGKGDAYWHDSHRNKHDTYFGYWSFEAAAVAKILDIDDTALKNHPHYPYDARHG